MFNFDDITKEDIKEDNLNWLEIPDHPQRMLIVGGMISHEPGIDKIYLYAKDPSKAKYQLLINKGKIAG